MDLAREALKLAQRALPLYGSARSRHDFTLPQLFTILVLRQFFRTDYRGIVQILHDFPNLQKVLALKKIPHFTTVQKAHQRFEKKGSGFPCWMLFADAPASGA